MISLKKAAAVLLLTASFTGAHAQGHSDSLHAEVWFRSYSSSMAEGHVRVDSVITPALIGFLAPDEGSNAVIRQNWLIYPKKGWVTFVELRDPCGVVSEYQLSDTTTVRVDLLLLVTMDESERVACKGGLFVE